MLTASQVEVVGYIGDGAVYHEECARRKFSELTVSKAEAGLTNSASLSPLIRYSLDEWAGEDAYAYAEDRIQAFEYDHPRTAALLGLGFNGRNRWRLLDRLAERFEDIAGPTCDVCLRPLTQPAGEEV